MTLVVAANSRESIWLVADRRLSSDGKVVRDDAKSKGSVSIERKKPSDFVKGFFHFGIGRGDRI